MIYGTPGDKREILLTFDDGPHQSLTPKLLDELAKHDIKALFFVLGQALETAKGQEIIKRAAAEGHAIGNHTYSHSDLTKLTPEQVRDEIVRTEHLIGDASRGIKVLRPPYGAHNAVVDAVVKDLGYALRLWNVDSLDWHPKYREGAWVQHAMDQIEARQHCLVLAHDIHPTTVGKIADLIGQISALPDAVFTQYA
jgi:peptidoglycan/xylan/chitin deacetylase (PgdA/CDA1 family)